MLFKEVCAFAETAPLLLVNATEFWAWGDTNAEAFMVPAMKAVKIDAAIFMVGKGYF
jgi:hypothetical protein